MQYNAQQDVKVVRRYYTGTGILRKGQSLSYDHAATKTDADPKLRLGHAVTDIAAGNVGFLAGVVPDSEAGKTGPCFVELLTPQQLDVVDAEVDGATAVVAGDFLEPDATKGALIKATAGAGDNLFKSFEAQAVNGKVVVRIQKV